MAGCYGGLLSIIIVRAHICDECSVLSETHGHSIMYIHIIVACNFQEINYSMSYPPLTCLYAITCKYRVYIPSSLRGFCVLLGRFSLTAVLSDSALAMYCCTCSGQVFTQLCELDRQTGTMSLDYRHRIRSGKMGIHLDTC